jgi:hypothetical protein
MQTRYIPPDVDQVSWMVHWGAHHAYLSLTTKMHEMLCTYSTQHGLPNGNIRKDEERIEYEVRLASEIQVFEVPSMGRPNDREYRSLLADTIGNKNIARDLHGIALTNQLHGTEIDEFLNSLLDAYVFVATASRNTRRRQGP